MSGVSYQVEGGIAILTLENPPVNALSLPVRAGAHRRAAACATGRAEVRALVLTGARGTFSAGADIGEVCSGAALQPPLARDVQALIEASRKPVVAAIEGVALGGGCELALTCHWRSPRATVRVGPAGGQARTDSRRRRHRAAFTRLAGPEAALECAHLRRAASSRRARARARPLDELSDAVLPAALEFAARAAAQQRPLPLASERTERLRT